jgi:hypothetical protein
MAKKVSKLTTAKVVALPATKAETHLTLPKFEDVYLEVKNGNIAISREQYAKIRLLKMNRGYEKSALSLNARTQFNDEFAAKEFGSDAMEGVLRWLWDKYIDGKVKDPFIAQILFSVLVKGVENAYAALTKWLRSKNVDVADNIEDTIKLATEVAQSGKIEDFKAEINSHVDDIKRLNEEDAIAGKKLNWFRKWILNPLKSIFS